MRGRYHNLCLCFSMAKPYLTMFCVPCPQTAKTVSVQSHLGFNEIHTSKGTCTISNLNHNWFDILMQQYLYSGTTLAERIHSLHFIDAARLLTVYHSERRPFSRTHLGVAYTNGISFIYDSGFMQYII